MSDLVLTPAAKRGGKRLRAPSFSITAVWQRFRHAGEPRRPAERRAAWEIAEVTSVERYDVAPWL